MTNNDNKLSHVIQIFKENLKKISFSYYLIIPIFLVTAFLGGPFFDLYFALSFLLFPIISLLIVFPTVLLLDRNNESTELTEEKHDTEEHWTFIDNRFNKTN